ncbi:4-diphosphocytidyl-2-C-methyl-D-erythritol kinase [Daejeonella rubra]|uniref:4-diphosphocytidyl-2-C-methyl-D-erythritol kinase n=1 Tax=Daejeonella rubra TaxID=990371 RepID=A0A1G9QJY0_9SPHI|nr:4-(cytidine 5'-diphospho)-2-C-methyl-D-erythritol kinase [Daejeonella rubra]SDM10575.1 4-diphosphocytidyl-2-C-methyl-D-erythritol kinase [Daejeonella rubra]
MILFPNAKINIGLNILSRRTDGYHNLETIFYPLVIRDALEVVEADQLEFTSSGLAIPGNATDNLCIKAYNLLALDHKLPPVHIHLHKHIPIGAGLGGGSADASFFIRLMNEKFGLGMDVIQMEAYASQLGSDCAFFIKNKPALAVGKGDQLQTIDLDLGKYFIVLVMPAVQVSTSEAYRGVSPAAVSSPLSDLIRLPVEEWRSVIKNDFEPSVFSQYPIIGEIKSKLYNAGALFSSMSGSGSSVFGIFKEELKLPDLEQNNKIFYGV